MRRRGDCAAPARSPFRPRRAEQIAQVRALALKLRPGVEHPVVVHAGQEIAPVLREAWRHGRGRRRCHRRPPRQRQPRARRLEDRASRRGRSRCRASTDRRTSRPGTVRLPSADADDAARGAGWSAPGHPSNLARTGRRSAAGSEATRRGRPERQPGQPRATKRAYAAGPLIGDRLLSQEKYVRHVAPASWNLRVGAALQPGQYASWNTRYIPAGNFAGRARRMPEGGRSGYHRTSSPVTALPMIMRWISEGEPDAFAATLREVLTG